MGPKGVKKVSTRHAECVRHSGQAKNTPAGEDPAGFEVRDYRPTEARTSFLVCGAAEAWTLM